MFLPGSFDLIQIAVIGIIGAGIFLVYKNYQGGSARSPRRFTTPLFLFTKRKEIFELKVENRGNIMLPARGYGYVERQGLNLAYRFGRVSKTNFDPKITENSRRRKQIYIVRENDPAPLNIYNFDGGYRGQPVTREELEGYENANLREATMVALSEGADKNITGSRMSMAVVISISITGIIWLLVAVKNGGLF